MAILKPAVGREMAMSDALKLAFVVLVTVASVLGDTYARILHFIQRNRHLCRTTTTIMDLGLDTVGSLDDVTVWCLRHALQ